jgi:hypothetical protein
MNLVDTDAPWHRGAPSVERDWLYVASNHGVAIEPPPMFHEPPPCKARFKSTTAFCREYEPLSYVVNGILREGFLYTVTAKTGAGKTAFNIMAAIAIAMGNNDILGTEVRQGRVAYLAFENPDDVRMRLMVAAHFHGIDWRDIKDQIVVLDMREPPETILAGLRELAVDKAFSFIALDTLQAGFDGKDANDNVQTGEYMRRLRPLTQINGKPAMLVSAHPIKSATEETLVPYGGGAILNEVDGNLTLWKGDGGLVRLHHNKLRGLEFDPLTFQIQTATTPDVRDKEGVEIALPIMLPSNERAAEDREATAYELSRRLLLAMIASPGAPQSKLGAAIGKSKSVVNRQLHILRQQKLVAVTLGKWNVTAKGREAAK